MPVCVFGLIHSENVTGGKLNASAARCDYQTLGNVPQEHFGSIQSLKKRNGGDQVPKLLFFFHPHFLSFFLSFSILNKASLKFHTGITVSSLMLLP